MKTSTETLIKAMRIVSEGNDGVVSVAIAEAAQRLEEQQDRIKRLEEFARTIENDFDHDEDAHRYGTTCRVCDAEDLLKETKAKEAKL